MQGRVHTYYEYRPCGSLSCWQVCETHEQEERLTHRVDHIDFAHAMTMMGIVGAGTTVGGHVHIGNGKDDYSGFVDAFQVDC